MNDEKKFKHTPGPWWWCETMGDKLYVQSTRKEAKTYYEGNVAKIPNRKGEGVHNARLIAEAPNLLLACITARVYLKELLNMAPDCEETEQLANTVIFITDTIKRAVGLESNYFSDYYSNVEVKE